MHEEGFESVRAYGLQPGFEIEELNGAFEIKFNKDNLTFRVTVAFSVLEWFIDIEDEISGLKFHDWFDYAGYDQSPKGELASEMIDDLHRLFSAVSKTSFRLKKGRTFFSPSDKCEWLVDGEWVGFDSRVILKDEFEKAWEPNIEKHEETNEHRGYHNLRTRTNTNQFLINIIIVMVFLAICFFVALNW